MLNWIDSHLSKVTMYRLLIYCMSALLIVAFAFSFFKLLPFGPLPLLVSTAVLIALSLSFNQIFAGLLKVQVNVESDYITALILALIISPSMTGGITSDFGFLFWAAALAMASKYILIYHNKHIFNPAALAVAVTAYTIGGSASWWVGSAYMLPFVTLAGFLIVRKVQKTIPALVLIGTTLTLSIILTISRTNALTTLDHALVTSALIFFTTVMFTEPLTMPPTKNRQIIYAVVVGILFTPQIHFGPVYFSPELALIAGNLLSFILSPKGRVILTLKEIKEAGAGIFDFIFTPDKKFNYRPGQFMEWNLGHDHPDNRGNRRFITLASSPTEETIRMGVRFYDKPSSFKIKLRNMKPGDTLSASQLAGDFTLPENTEKKLVFVAGGIGVTPFRSMLKYLCDKNEKRDITIIYSSQTADEFAYGDVLSEAAKKIGLKIIFTLTNKEKLPSDWKGCTGYITKEMISKEIPDFKNRVFFISGPHSMVCGTENVLRSMGISAFQIKTDFFPGLA